MLIKSWLTVALRALSLDSNASMTGTILFWLYLKILYNKYTNCSHFQERCPGITHSQRYFIFIHFSSASCCQVTGTRAEVTMCWIYTITYRRKQSESSLTYFLFCFLQLKGIRAAKNIQPRSLRCQPVSKNHAGTCCRAQQQIYGPEKSTIMQ